MFQYINQLVTKSILITIIMNYFVMTVSVKSLDINAFLFIGIKKNNYFKIQ